MNKSDLSKVMMITAFAVILTSGPLSAFADQDFTATFTFDQVIQEGPSNPSLGASGSATLTLDNSNPNDPKLHYSIQLNGIDIDGAQTGDAADDLTGLHIHAGVPGGNGPHVLNILSEPCDDDADVAVNAGAGTIQGTYDDSDLSTVATCGVVPGDAGKSKPLSDFLATLYSGNLYFQVHTNNNPSPNGELRAQIVPDGIVGGESLTIDNTALILAGLQSSTVWMIPTLAGLAGVGFYLVRLRANKD